MMPSSPAPSPAFYSSNPSSSRKEMVPRHILRRAIPFRSQQTGTQLLAFLTPSGGRTSPGRPMFRAQHPHQEATAFSEVPSGSLTTPTAPSSCSPSSNGATAAEASGNFPSHSLHRCQPRTPPGGCRSQRAARAGGPWVPATAAKTVRHMCPLACPGPGWTQLTATNPHAQPGEAGA